MNIKKLMLLSMTVVILNFISINLGHAGEMSGSAANAEDVSKTASMDEDMMKMWSAYATPGEEHQVLEQLVGDWTYVTKWRMSKEDPWKQSTGESHHEWILDGRFVQQSVKGDPEETMPEPYKGLGIIGYDKQLEEYVYLWLDNMGTGIMKGTGTYDVDQKTLEEEGTFTCPLRGGKTDFRGVTTFVDENSFTYEMYTADMNGNEFVSMSITYKKK